ncbi:hypothetical protein FA13DRAFT_1711972 [Coprinellus micaceus]|uniref:Uncharacterized protein n=1 Tax=Coprinellus micaceus TaxID=71717 RepID=A0A4Y7T2H1_COPMI|nr:hypothetical protein FA13DRAFT_1711972 [Coprinellus micaceus]
MAFQSGNGPSVSKAAMWSSYEVWSKGWDDKLVEGVAIRNGRDRPPMSTHPAAAPVPPERDTSGNVNLHSRLQALAQALQSLGPDELARVVGTQDDARSLDSLMQLCTSNAPSVSNPPLAPLPTLNPHSGESTLNSHHPATSNSPSVPSSSSLASLVTAPTSGSSHPLPRLVVPNLSVSDSKVFGKDMSIGRAVLDTVFYYDSIDDFCEYPKLLLRGIRHLVPIPPLAINDKDYNPTSDIQIPILVNDQGVELDCVFSYQTCQGIKACPFLYDTLKTMHYEASREAVSKRLQSTCALNILPNDFGKQKSWYLMAELRSRTLTFYKLLMSHGCGGPPQEETIRSGEELEAYGFQQEELLKACRGHPPKPSCDGHILFCDGPKPLVWYNNSHCCEHYGNGSPDHLRDMSPSDGIYDLEYLRALFNKDQDIIDDIEEELLVSHQLGPRASCTYTMNCSSVRVHCPTPHRTKTGELIMAEMEQIRCTCKFQVYLPKLGQRHRCPWALIVSLGIYTHPVPVPSQTPYIIREKLSDLLTTMPDDLADLTTRRFMRHPMLQSFLVTELNVTPPLQAPQLSDLHPSLANWDHLNATIEKVRTKVLPKGVGWNGLLHIKGEQD